MLGPFLSKSKQASVVAKPLTDLVKDLKREYPYNHFTITSDRGNEFLGPVKKLFQENDFQIYYQEVYNEHWEIEVYRQG